MPDEPKPGQMSPEDQKKQEDYISSLPDFIYDHTEFDEIMESYSDYHVL